jgi:predicted RNase H-like HicB family nuclease
MKEKIEEILKKPYSKIFIVNDDNSYSAEIMEFSGCYSQGETIEEAMSNLNEMAEEWIEASLERGQNIPEPEINQGYSGRIVLRMPKGLHRRAARMAEREGVSLNQYLVTSVASRVGAEDFCGRLAHRFEQRMISSMYDIRWGDGIGNMGDIGYTLGDFPVIGPPLPPLSDKSRVTEAANG